MKGFALQNGDVLIENNEIQMTYDTDLAMQTIKSVLSTVKGEWFVDWNEGVEYSEILGKKEISVSDEVIKSKILDGLKQYDENLIIDVFEKTFDKEARKLQIKLGVINNETEERMTINLDL